MINPIKVVLSNSKITFSKGDEFSLTEQPGSWGYKITNLSTQFRSDDLISIRSYGIQVPELLDINVDMFVNGNGDIISPNVILSELISYFDLLGIGEAAQGGDGSGTVESVNGIDPVGGDVSLTQDDIPSGTTAKQFTSTDKNKLDNQSGVNTGDQDLSGYALLNSPEFTGTPTAPTPSTDDDSTKIATTAFVKAQGSASVTIDAVPTDGSNNPVSSNGVFDELTLRPKQINLTRAQANAMAAGDFDPTINYAITTTV